MTAQKWDEGKRVQKSDFAMERGGDEKRQEVVNEDEVTGRCGELN